MKRHQSHTQFLMISFHIHQAVDDCEALIIIITGSMLFVIKPMWFLLKYMFYLSHRDSHEFQLRTQFCPSVWMNRSETKLYSQTQRLHNLTTEHCDGTKGQSLIPNHSLSVKAETYSYLDGHVSHIRILWALHEDERWVSCVLYYHLVCYFIRRWGESIEQWLTPSFSQIQFMHSNEVFYSCSIDFEVHLSNYILFFSPQPQKQL